MASLDTHSLEAWLSSVLGDRARVHEAVMIPGGASKETWSVDAEIAGRAQAVIVRRDAAGDTADDDSLDLGREYRLIEAVHRHGVPVPAPYGYTDDLEGRSAFAMARVGGESIGRRVVRAPELASARQRLPRQMADTLAALHAVPATELPALPGPPADTSPVTAAVSGLTARLDRFPEPHPAIELGLDWLRRNAGSSTEVVPCHGDFRIGNLMVDDSGLAAVLDWELAHFGPPGEDLGWPLIRAWRFGNDDLKLGGVDGAETFLARYNERSGRTLTPADLSFWEVYGNVRWAIIQMQQAERHLSGGEPSVEYAVLGRMTAETEREIVDLVERLG